MIFLLVYLSFEGCPGQNNLQRYDLRVTINYFYTEIFLRYFYLFKAINHFYEKNI